MDTNIKFIDVIEPLKLIRQLETSPIKLYLALVLISMSSSQNLLR